MKGHAALLANDFLFYSLSEPTDSPFVRNLMLLLANNDSRVISQNVKLGMRQAAADGLWVHTPPPSYKIARDERGRNGHLVPDEQAPIIRRLFELAATGKYSTSRMRDHAQGARPTDA